MKKALWAAVSGLVLLPKSVFACSIDNLSSCFTETISNFILDLINAPLTPLLELVISLLSADINTSLFSNVHAIILYVLAFFYVIILAYAGLNFMLSGHDQVKRENAKSWLKNIVFMVVLVSASVFLYDLAVSINSILTKTFLDLIDKNFFLITLDNLNNVFLEIVFGIVYLAVLMLSVLILIIRYVFVSAGSIFVPIGVFLYFIPFLKNYGKLILNFLLICLFLSFFNVLLLLVCSRLIEIELFAGFKILVVISAFLLIDFLMLYLMLFGLIKSAFSFGREIKTAANV